MRQNFDTLLQTILHYKLFPSDSIVLVAVSGGADSLALLHWLANHQHRLQLSIQAATLNHGLRPEAADDVAFVQSICEQLTIACTIAHADVLTIAKTEHIGIEAAARKARYDFLADAAQKIAATHIVTAHHADDQSETILMHLLRGSGTQGLVGMQMLSAVPYHPHLKLVRPLLLMRRAKIEAYCAEHQLQARIDPSNFDTQYFRNEIRHEILPRLRLINPQLDHALARLADIANTEQEFIAQNYQEYFKKQAKFSERVSLSTEKFQNWHPAMQRRFLLDALDYLKIEPDFEHIQHAIQVTMKGQVGAIAEFSGDARLRLGYDSLYIEPVSLSIPTGDYLQIDRSYPIEIPSKTVIDDWVLIVSKDPMPNYDACLNIPEGASISLRTRKAGDRFMPKGMEGHSRKIKKWLIDNKIPTFVRDGLPLVIISNIIAAIIVPQKWGIAEKFAKNEVSQCNVYFKVGKL